MVNELNNMVLLHVWIHSHVDTGQPYSIDVFEVCGRVHMAWYANALEPESVSGQRDLAEQFYEHIGRTDDSAWFVCRMDTETGGERPEDYVTVFGVLPTPPTT